MEKHFEYFKYVIKHKWFVFLKCCEYGIIWRGIVHDMSKFSPIEWFAYVDCFYGTKNDNAFNKAWLHHQHCNPHHWQWWILQNDEDGVNVLPMDQEYIKELLADWYGAGRAITGKDNTKQWYESNKEKIILHSETRKIIEQEIYKK